MRASSNNTPDYRLFVFTQNTTCPTIFDLVGNPEKPPIRYFSLTAPRAPFLIQQGAQWVLETREHKVKIAFTGLVPTGIPGWSYGDLIEETHKGKRRKSFVLFHFKGNTIALYYFRSYTLYPAKRPLFIQWFIRKLV